MGMYVSKEKNLRIEVIQEAILLFPVSDCHGNACVRLLRSGIEQVLCNKPGTILMRNEVYPCSSVDTEESGSYSTSPSRLCTLNVSGFSHKLQALFKKWWNAGMGRVFRRNPL